MILGNKRNVSSNILVILTCHHMYPYKTDTKDIYGREGDGKKEADNRMMQPPEAGKGKEQILP